LARFLALRVECRRGNLVGDGHQLAQRRALAHDFGIPADIGGRRRVVRQRIKIGNAADVVGLAGTDQ